MPITNPKLVFTPATVVAPVPPLDNAMVVPLHIPEVMVPTVAISVPTNLLAGIDPANLSAAILPANCALVIPAVLDKLLVVNPVAEIVPPLIEIPEPAPAVNAVCLLLNVVQSVLVRYQFTLEVAAVIENVPLL